MTAEEMNSGLDDVTDLISSQQSSLNSVSSSGLLNTGDA